MCSIRFFVKVWEPLLVYPIFYFDKSFKAFGEFDGSELESRLHELFKKAVFAELEREGYNLYVEPPEPPLSRLSWSQYRPDVFGILSNEAESMFAIVECETDPRIKRIIGKLSKIRQSLTIQKILSERNVLLRLLLVIPSGMLHRVNCSEIRGFWEIWIANNRGEIVHKILKKDHHIND